MSITRPANITAYDALDVIGVADADVAADAGSAIHTLATVGHAGGSVIITGAQLRIDLAAVPAGMTTFRAHLYDAEPTAILDNAAFDLVAGDRSKYLGYVEIPAPVDLGSTLVAQVDALHKLVKLAAGSTSLFAQLQTVGAFTPTSGEVYRLTLRTEQA